MSLFYTLTCLVLVLTANPWLVRSGGPTVNVTKHISFPKLTQEFKLLGSARVSENRTLQIPDPSQGLDMKHQAGRAIYGSPVRLYDPDSDTPASFRSTFSFRFQNISVPAADGGSGGSGLTFVIVPDEFTVGRAGPWLGMINDACDDEYKAVAIEFDTRFNPEFGDPSDNHVGIDLGTMVSTRAINASSVGVFLSDGSLHRAWISYDGPTRSVDIRLAGEGREFPSEPLFSGPLDLAPFLNEYMFVGFSASTGNSLAQVHVIESWDFTSTSSGSLRLPSDKTCRSKIAIGKEASKAPGSFLIFTGAVVLAAAILLSLFYNWRRRSKKSSLVAEPEKLRRPTPPNKPRKFSFSELSIATSNFDDHEILGRDSRGAFYRGRLPDGCHAAIKQFLPKFASSSSVAKLVKEAGKATRHPNVVPIRGWCREKVELLVVYELFPNGGLDSWLFGAGVLPWTRRLRVVRDVAEGLAFLHSRRIAHKNLKPSSVFLDASFRAAVGDFGFVLAGEDPSRFEEAVAKSADVFEFGVLVLEVVAGKRRSEEVLETAWRLHEGGRKSELVDQRMGKMLRVDQVVRVLDIALLCTLNHSKGRPESMEEVVELLSSERPVTELPLSRPVSLFPYSSMNAGLCTTYSCASFN